MCFANKVTIALTISTSQVEEGRHKDAVSQRAGTKSRESQAENLGFRSLFSPLVHIEVYVSAASLLATGHRRSTEGTIVNTFG